MMSAQTHLKSLLRNEVKNRLSQMSKEAIQEGSVNIVQQLLKLPFYKSSSRIAVYLSLPEEVQTHDIVRDIFASGKECFVPRYTKTDMQMVKLRSLQDLESLPLTSWKIKQPSIEEEREDAFEKGGVDLVIVPGLAFSMKGERLGRGKGYYDRYLSALEEERKKRNLCPPVTVGLCFSEQLVDSIPVSPHDFHIHHVIIPQNVQSV